MSTQFIGMTYDEWNKIYKPLSQNFETFGAEFDFVKSVDPHYVWTVRDSEGPYTVITNGPGFVNRLEYVVTLIPWHEGQDILVSNH